MSRLIIKENIKMVYIVRFCSEYDETFEHIFKCNAGLRVPKQLKDFMLQSFSMAPSEKLLKKLGYFLDKYNKYRQEVI